MENKIRLHNMKPVKIEKTLENDDFYDGIMEKTFEKFHNPFGGSRYARPYGFFGFSKMQDDIHGIDFIFYDRNGKFALNVYFEKVEDGIYVAYYAGCSYRKNLKYCRQIAEELTEFLNKEAI